MQGEHECYICRQTDLSSRHPQVPDYACGQGPTVAFLECKACGHLQQDPIPKDGELAQLYPSSYAPYRNRGVLALLKNRQARWLARRLARHLGSRKEAVLELGCGRGDLLLGLASCGYRSLFGVDLHSGSSDALKERGIEFIPGDFSGCLPRFAPSHLSAILLIHSLEHHPDPRSLLAQWWPRLKAGGVVLVITPDSHSLSHRFFGRFWSGLHAPRHPHVFSRVSLETLAKELGAKTWHQPLLDPNSWAYSVQHLLRGIHGPIPRSSGLSAPVLLLLPLWGFCAWLERIFGDPASFLLGIEKLPGEEGGS